MLYASFCLLLLTSMLFLLHKKGHKKHFYILSAFLGISSFSLYYFVGSPQIPDWPYVESPQEKELKYIIHELETKIKTNPKDMESWRIIGDAYQSLHLIPQALNAYETCADSYPNDIDFLMHHAECLIENEKGVILPQSLEKIEKVLSLKTNHPLALYYKALYIEQMGKKEESLEIQNQLKSLLEVQKKA